MIILIKYVFFFSFYKTAGVIYLHINKQYLMLFLTTWLSWCPVIGALLRSDGHHRENNNKLSHMIDTFLSKSLIIMRSRIVKCTSSLYESIGIYRLSRSLSVIKSARGHDS